MRYLMVFSLTLILLACGQSEPPSPAGISVAAALGGDSEGFLRATEPRAFSFPADHGSHPGYRNEWWYFTGNLATAEGRRFGYQLTFFRNALTPPGAAAGESAWSSDEVWMAHLAISDIQSQQHHSSERWARNGMALAGARQQPFSVWLEDWTLRGDGSGDFPWELQAQDAAFAIALTLQGGSKPPVLQGNNGLSQKSAAAGQASYYYSLTRLPTTGVLQLGDAQFSVTGDSWLDREWSTSVLADNQQGWDWFALQLDDQRELMFYQLRLTGGGADAASAGSLIMPDGTLIRLDDAAVSRQPLRYWQADDGSRYPVAWRLKIPQQQIDWEVRAVFDQQQMPLSVRYWEGAVEVFAKGQSVGRGYLEMTGY